MTTWSVDRNALVKETSSNKKSSRDKVLYIYRSTPLLVLRQRKSSSHVTRSAAAWTETSFLISIIAINSCRRLPVNNDSTQSAGRNASKGHCHESATRALALQGPKPCNDNIDLCMSQFGFRQFELPSLELEWNNRNSRDARNSTVDVACAVLVQTIVPWSTLMSTREHSVSQFGRRYYRTCPSHNPWDLSWGLSSTVLCLKLISVFWLPTNSIWFGPL